MSDILKKFGAHTRNIYAYAKRHKILTGIFLMACVYGAYHYYVTRSTTTTTYQYVMVKRGSIESSVSGTGQVTPNSQVDLKPKVNANVVGVYVKSGDRVKAGQVLFRLDATDAYKQVRDAKIGLEAAQLTLEKLKNPKATDISAITNSIKQQEASKASEDLKVKTAYQTLLNSNLVLRPEVDYTIETAPTVSGSYMLGKEGQLKLNVYQGGPTGYSFSASGVASCIGQINQTVAQPLCDTGLYIKWNSSNPQTSWVINIPNKESTSYLSNYTAWQTTITNRDTNNAESDRTIEDLNQKLADLTPDDDNIDVRSAMLTVQQRQNALADAQNNLSNYVITAPFDGVMASVAVDIGSSAVMASANSSSALGTIVTDKQLAQITLNESDIAKVHLGQKAKVIIDVLDNAVLDGTVAEITTLGTVTSGVVTYKVKVAFASSSITILPNMSVSVDIITDSKDGVLYIPNQAVKHDSGGYYVEEDKEMNVVSSSTRKLDRASSTGAYASNDNSASSTYRRGMGSSTYNRNATSSPVGLQTDVVLTRIPITIGMQSDTLTEIMSGLREGERIVWKKTTVAASQATAAPSVTSLLRPQGGGAVRTGGNAGFRAQ